MEQLVVTRRGIININEVTLNDEVYTAKRRWRKVVGIKEESTIKISKTTHSFHTPVGLSQYAIGGKEAPFYIPRDKNSDTKPVKYWYDLGSRLSANPAIYTKSFFIPFSVLMLNSAKSKAFINGFFSNKVELSKLNRRSRLGLVFMCMKMSPHYDYRTTFSVKKSDFISKSFKFKVLEIDQDDSYCVNGLFVINL